jgi:hypothetical protein
MSEQRPTCSRLRRDGKPCRAKALPGRDVCAFHAEDLAAKRKAGREEGGRRSKRPAVLSSAGDVTFGTVADVTALLASTASQVRRGEVDCRVGNCLAYIAATALRALLPDETARELAELRRQLEELKQRGDDGAAPGAGGPPPGSEPPDGGGGEPRADEAEGGPGDDLHGGGDDAGPVGGDGPALFR